jgi:hypothetical protein
MLSTWLLENEGKFELCISDKNFRPFINIINFVKEFEKKKGYSYLPLISSYPDNPFPSKRDQTYTSGVHRRHGIKKKCKKTQ